MTLSVDKESRHAKAEWGKVIVLEFVANMGNVARGERAEVKLSQGSVEDRRFRLGYAGRLGRHSEVKVYVESVGLQRRSQRRIEIGDNSEAKTAGLQGVQTLVDVWKHLVSTLCIILHNRQLQNC